MEPKAGDDFNHLKKEAIERKLSKRRSKIQEMMMEKRKLLAYHMELEQQQSEQQEESEVPKEEAEQKGRFNLNQCHKKAQRKHRRRCWYCKKKDHIKRHCPNLNCFYCHKPGHFKKDCWKWKIDTLLNRALEEKRKRDKNRKRKRNKEKEHKRITSIYKHRLKESEFIKRKDKHILKYKNLEIGVFLEPTTPPDLQKMRLKPIAWKKVDVLVKQEIRLEKITLLDDFLNACGCGNINLRKSEFINHINTKHGGTVPTQSQINQPAWTHAVLFSSDEIEQLYCQTTVDLT